jgi:hypothetical protein
MSTENISCGTDYNTEISEIVSYKDNDSNIDNQMNTPDINEIELTKKETFYFKIIDKYYKKLETKKIELMIEIIECKSKISLRLLDWFVTRYADKHKIRFEKNNMIERTVLNDDEKFDKKIDRGFNVHISYKAQLKSYKKRYFDPFRRRKKFKYYFDKDKKIVLCTTIGQLNFFKWAFSNDVINYVMENFAVISKAMINTNKIDKKRKLKEKEEKTKKETKIDKQEQEVNIKKNGINIVAKGKIKKDEVKIVLSFD